jgi:hypothetical protein
MPFCFTNICSVFSIHNLSALCLEAGIFPQTFPKKVLEIFSPKATGKIDSVCLNQDLTNQFFFTKAQQLPLHFRF